MLRNYEPGATSKGVFCPPYSDSRYRLAPLSSPHRSRVLEALCETLNKTNTPFPGTRL
jgi:hypothetical protein